MSLMLEVEDNANCDGVPQLIFNTMGEPRQVTEVVAGDFGQKPSPHRVTGWSSERGGSPCPAYAVRIEESGAGEALLVYGGDWGLRFMPLPVDEEWSLDSPNQWGENFLSLDDESQVRFLGPG
ncbi:MAG: hypothetical protein OXC99_04765 [Chloroflexi bacterium]|nr:hypothetical protein [Chloroflexota bacterium]